MSTTPVPAGGSNVLQLILYIEGLARIVAQGVASLKNILAGNTADAEAAAAAHLDHADSQYQLLITTAGQAAPPPSAAAPSNVVPIAPPAAPASAAVPVAAVPSSADLDAAAEEKKAAAATGGTHAPAAGAVGETGAHGVIGSNATE